MPIHILNECGGDWTKASKVIEQTRSFLFCFQINMTIHDRIVKIDIDRFQEDITTITSDLLEIDQQWK